MHAGRNKQVKNKKILLLVYHNYDRMFWKQKTFQPKSCGWKTAKRGEKMKNNPICGIRKRTGNMKLGNRLSLIISGILVVALTVMSGIVGGFAGREINQATKGALMEMGDTNAERIKKIHENGEVFSGVICDNIRSLLKADSGSEKKNISRVTGDRISEKRYMAEEILIQELQGFIDCRSFRTVCR